MSGQVYSSNIKQFLFVLESILMVKNHLNRSKYSIAVAFKKYPMVEIISNQYRAIGLKNPQIPDLHQAFSSLFEILVKSASKEVEKSYRSKEHSENFQI